MDDVVIVRDTPVEQDMRLCPPFFGVISPGALGTPRQHRHLVEDLVPLLFPVPLQIVRPFPTATNPLAEPAKQLQLTLQHFEAPLHDTQITSGWMLRTTRAMSRGKS